MDKKTLSALFVCILFVAMYANYNVAAVSCIPKSIRCSQPVSICSAEGNSWKDCASCENFCPETVSSQVKNVHETISESETPESKEGYGVMGQIYSFTSEAFKGNAYNLAAMVVFLLFLVVFSVYWKRLDG